MKLVRLHGPDDVRLDEVAEPAPGPRDAVVRVQACGICGSDVGYIAQGGLAGPTREPMPLGHELSGRVEAVGAEVRGLSPGMRVVLNPLGAGNQIGNGGPEGGFAPLLLVRNTAAGGCLFPIPDDLSPERAALCEPLGVGMQAVSRAGVAPGEKVVVFGAGPIGLAAIAALRFRGIDDVISVDLSERRLEIARRLGARETLNPARGEVWERIQALHGTDPVFGMPMAGSDAYIEASGHSPLIGEIIAHSKAGARLSVVALHKREVPVSFLLLLMKQLTIAGSLGYPEDYTESIELARSLDVATMITHRFPLERFQEALAVARDPTAGAKVMVEPA